jgi:hypothetical protein
MADSIRHFTVGHFRGFTMVDSVVQFPAAPFLVNAPTDLQYPQMGGSLVKDRYVSFLVRIWLADAGQRVEVQHIQSGDCVAFDSLRTAWRWVRERCATGDTSHPGEDADDHRLSWRNHSHE